MNLEILKNLYYLTVKPSMKDEFKMPQYSHICMNIKAYPSIYIGDDKWLIYIESTDKNTITNRLINKGSGSMQGDIISDEVAKMITLSHPNLSDINYISKRLELTLLSQNWMDIIKEYRLNFIINVYKNRLESILLYEESKGVSGCIYGDSPYNSIDVSYGYNTCLDEIKSDVYSTLESIKQDGKR